MLCDGRRHPIFTDSIQPVVYLMGLQRRRSKKEARSELVSRQSRCQGPTITCRRAKLASQSTTLDPNILPKFQANPRLRLLSYLLPRPRRCRRRALPVPVRVRPKRQKPRCRHSSPLRQRPLRRCQLRRGFPPPKHPPPKRHRHRHRPRPRCRYRHRHRHSRKRPLRQRRSLRRRQLRRWTRAALVALLSTRWSEGEAVAVGVGAWCLCSHSQSARSPSFFFDLRTKLSASPFHT
jgi:hypothetical protein